MTEEELLRVPCEFLNAAVLIDDELYWGAPTEDSANEQDDEKVNEPDEYDFGDTDSISEEAPSKALSSPIDAEQVVDGFSDLGLVCATYRWSEKHSRFPNSSDKADLIILDWKLDNKEAVGTTAVEFLNRRLAQDLAGRRRLRYIVIYTDKPMAGVIEKLSDDLNVPESLTLAAEDNCIEIKEINGPSLWRILYQSKTITAEADLAKAVLKDFSKFLDGLLPRAVMSGVAEIRNRTFEHLYRFNKTLDPVIASHLLAKRSSELEFSAASDTFSEYVIGLIVNDFSDALYGSELLNHTSSALEVDHHMTSTAETTMRWNQLEVKATPDEISTLISEQDYSKFLSTAETVFGLTSEKKKEAFKSGRSPMEFSIVDNDQYAKLSEIDLMNNYPREISQQLQLKSGVIVRFKDATHDEWRYLICIQPLCDAVRLDTSKGASSRFAFIEFQVVQPTKKFTFVVKVGDEYVYLLTKHKMSEVVMASFSASSGTRDIRTVGEARERAFLDIDKTKYMWLAELKEIYAIELQNLLSSQTSRIGNNKFEWLRTKSS